MPPSRLNRATLPGNAVWKRRRKLRRETGVIDPRSEMRASSLASFSMSSLMTSFKASSCSCWVVDAVPIRLDMKWIPYVPVNFLGLLTERSSAAERAGGFVLALPCQKACPDWLAATLPAHGRRLRLRSSRRLRCRLVRSILWVRSSWCCRSGRLPWRVWRRRRWRSARLPREVLRALLPGDTAARPGQWPRDGVGVMRRRWAAAGGSAFDPAGPGWLESCESAWRRWLWGECSSNKD